MAFTDTELNEMIAEETAYNKNADTAHLQYVLKNLWHGDKKGLTESYDRAIKGAERRGDKRQVEFLSNELKLIKQMTEAN